MTDNQFRSDLACMNGQHRWSAWGNFIPVMQELPSVFAPASPDKPTIEAYRWRHCGCGAAERETYATHERKLFRPGEDKEDG